MKYIAGVFVLIICAIEIGEVSSHLIGTKRSLTSFESIILIYSLINVRSGCRSSVGGINWVSYIIGSGVLGGGSR
jgi:hypothetical protein